MRQQTLRFGDAWARLGPWRGGGHIAHLVVAPDAPLSGAAILDCLERARAAGYDEVLTSAMGPAEGEPFVEACFTVRERLHLLTHEMTDEPSRPTQPPVSRATRRDRPAVLDLDDLAFTPFWRLGALGLRDALDATPVRQFRATRSDTEPLAHRLRDHRPRRQPGLPATDRGAPERAPSSVSGTRSSPTPCTGSGVKGSFVRT